MASKKDNYFNLPKLLVGDALHWYRNVASQCTSRADFIIVTTSFDEHVRIAREVLHQLREANLKANWDKCQFGRKRLRYLAHVIDTEGIRTDPEKIAAIAALTAPTNIRELRPFIVLLSWYR